MMTRVECSYLLEEERVAEWARLNGYRKLLLQAPDGIKRCLSSLVESLEERGLEVLLSGSHAWGGCDLAVREAEALGTDAIIHIGHHGPVRFKPPPNALFIAAYSKLEVAGVIERAAERLVREGAERVGLLTTIQHAHRLEEAEAVLRDYGVEVRLAKSPDPYMEEGLVTGCDVQAAEAVVKEVDAFLMVCGGAFHAVGVAFVTGARVIAADPYSGKVTDVEREARRVVALRLSHLSEALEAKEAVIIASTKPGQWVGSETLKRVGEALRHRGIRCKTLIVDDVERGVLEDYGHADLYVNTACPRLAVDDYELFPGPVVNLGEISYLLEGRLGAYTPRSTLETRLPACVKPP